MCKSGKTSLVCFLFLPIVGVVAGAFGLGELFGNTLSGFCKLGVLHEYFDGEARGPIASGAWDSEVIPCFLGVT